MSVAAIFVLLAVPLVSFAGTRLVRRYALSRLLDIPNDRSMHTAPTPRGGGLAIAVASLGALVVGILADWLSMRLGLAFLVGGLAVAAIGWIDDHGGVSSWVRFTIQTASSAFAVLMLGGFKAVDIGTSALELGAAGSLLAVFGITWAINFFNFMDGIDGIAVVEAITVAVVGGLLVLAGGRADIAWFALVIAGSAIGFLPWNWSPARIFLGDVGSGLLGFFFGVLAVASENAQAAPASVWGVLLGVFVVDATITLVRRLMRGERVYEAHRKHAYQRMVQSGLNHSVVSLSILGINIGLAALAILISYNPALSPLLIGAGLLILGAIYLGVERIKSFDG